MKLCPVLQLYIIAPAIGKGLYRLQLHRMLFISNTARCSIGNKYINCLYLFVFVGYINCYIACINCLYTVMQTINALLIAMLYKQLFKCQNKNSIKMCSKKVQKLKKKVGLGRDWWTCSWAGQPLFVYVVLTGMYHLSSLYTSAFNAL